MKIGVAAVRKLASSRCYKVWMGGHELLKYQKYGWAAATDVLSVWLGISY